MTSSRLVAARLSHLLLSGMCACASGCTSWPEEGGGGIAERRPAENVELTALEIRLQDAIARGSRHAYAAQTAEAELQLIRTRRTWTAGFTDDYLTNFATLDVLVRDIEAHVRHRPQQRASGRKAG